jgi:hypothetical protein
MNDSLQQPNDQYVAVRDSESQALKRQRVGKEFSQCLDAVLDQSEIMYNASNPDGGSQNNYDSAFALSLPSVVAPDQAPLVHKPGRPAFMMPLQSLASSSAMLPVAPPAIAEHLINATTNATDMMPMQVLPTLPSTSTAYAPLPVPASFPFPW